MTTSQPADAIEPDTAATTAEAEARAHVQAVVGRSGTSFFWAMRLLPEARRNAMFAVYAFCREVDDIADEPAPMAEKRRGLAGWREEIGRLYAGTPRYPTGVALLRPVRDYGLRREDFLALIDGMEMDAVEIRAPSIAALELYCDRVACAVGRLSVRAFGETAEARDEVAFALGQALQLTNILRDMDEDAERGRLYLPSEHLRAAGIESDEPEAVLAHPGLVSACEALAALAGRRFAEARAALARCDRRAMRPAIVMMHVYRRILEQLMARGWAAPRAEVGLGKAEKLWIALRHGLL